MDLLDAFFYGMVQGLTEYLPISSSAHLILFPYLLGKDDPGLAFNVFLHFGTLIATFTFFWREWLGVLSTLPGPVGHWFAPRVSKGTPRLHWTLLMVATAPALVVGGLFHDAFEEFFRGPETLVWTLPIGGLFLWLSDRLAKRTRTLQGTTWREVLWMGIAQCFALIPGVSRSGSTITGARMLGYERGDSARLSFLMSAPVVMAAVVYELKNFEALVQDQTGIVALLVAGGSSFLFGWIAIGGLLALLKRTGYFAFFIYRALLAAVVYSVLVP